MFKFSKFTLKKKKEEIYEKFEKCFFKLVWRKTSFLF